MPNRRNRTRKGGRGKDPKSVVSIVPAHSLTTITLSGVTGTGTVSLTPQNSSFGGLNEIGDNFDLFRFARLRYRIHPMDPTYTTNQVVAFFPDVDIQTQTVTQAAESPIAAVQTPFCGVPSRWVSVPRAQLKGMLDWYKCSPDAGAAEFESQGLIQLVGGLSDVMIFELEATVHFKNPVSSALQFARSIDRAVASGLVKRLPAPEHLSPVKPQVTKGDPQQGKSSGLTTFPKPPCKCEGCGT